MSSVFKIAMIWFIFVILLSFAYSFNLPPFLLKTPYTCNIFIYIINSMIYWIKRGNQDVNLINDKNPKQGYKFVLLVGENGSGKTIFLNFIRRILQKDNTSYKEIDKISVQSKYNLSDFFYKKFVSQCKYVTKVNGKEINLYSDYLFNRHRENYKLNIEKWKLLFDKDSILSFNRNVNNIDENETIQVDLNTYVIQNDNNKPIDVTWFYYSRYPTIPNDTDQLINSYIGNTLGNYPENVFSVYAIIDALNNKPIIKNGVVLNSNTYSKKELEQSIKDLFRIDEEFADMESNIDDNSKKDINKSFINNCLKDFYGEKKYIVDINKHLDKITLNGKHKPTIDKISDGVLHCLSLATYICKNRNSNGAYFLIDEPEISLHPRAQLEFSKFLDNNINNINQVFIATHSPFIVKSFIEKYPNDTRIVHFQHLKEKDKDVYKAEKIENFIFLDSLSISEINYHVYGIPSSEYYLQLYEHLKMIVKYEDLKFLDFDEQYLQGKYFELDIGIRDKDDNLLIINDKKELIQKQTYLTRLRHILVHGDNEKEYKKYDKNRNNDWNKTTHEFYKLLKNNKDKLIKDCTEDLIKLIKNFELEQNIEG